MTLQAGDRAWLAMAAAVTAWDMCGRETLSAAADRYHHARLWLTRTVIAYMAAHLLGVIPNHLDPLNALTRLRTKEPACPN